MTLMRIRKIAFLSLLGIALCSTRAWAAVVIQTESTTDLDALLTFNQFNPALGQLSEVVIVTSSTLRSSGSFSNTGRSTSTARTILDATYTLDLPNDTVTSPNEHIDTGILHIPSHDTLKWGPLSASMSTHDAFTLLSDLIAYQGNGTFDVAANIDININSSRSGTGTTTICNAANLEVTLYYCYIPNIAIPEASTLWGGLIAVGIAGFTLRTKRRVMGR